MFFSKKKSVNRVSLYGTIAEISATVCLSEMSTFCTYKLRTDQFDTPN